MFEEQMSESLKVQSRARGSDANDLQQGQSEESTPSALMPLQPLRPDLALALDLALAS